MPNYERLPNETARARAGRIRRETNQENDALGLMVGEWFKHGNAISRFHARYIDRMRPTVLRRATPEEIAEAEAKEQKRLQQQADALARDAVLDQPHYQAARSIASEIEWNIDSVIERLTPQEWIDLKAKIVDQA